jgi:hypothetical protein
VRLLVWAAAALVLPTAADAAPSDVNAQTFYAGAMALQAKGMRAVFDKRLKPMTAQMKDAGERSRAANLAASAAGKPLYCVPEGTKRAMGAPQVIALLGRLPEGERRSLSLFEAWKRALTREYPCR